MTDRLISPEDEPDVQAHRLAANDNETVAADVSDGDAAAEDEAADVEAHRLASNDDETVIDDDVEAHRLAANDNETVVDD
jgi:hypothetical protein